MTIPGSGFTDGFGRAASARSPLSPVEQSRLFGPIRSSVSSWIRIIEDGGELEAFARKVVDHAQKVGDEEVAKKWKRITRKYNSMRNQ